MNEDKNPINSGENDVYRKKSSRRIAVITVVVVLAVLLLNVAVSFIGDAQLWYIDLTRAKYISTDYSFYTLTDDCVRLIGQEAVPMIEQVNAEREARGEEPIKLNIVFCADRDDIENDSQMRYISYTARGLAKEYPHAIEVTYINMGKNPSAVQKYKTTSASTIYNSDVIVEFGTEYLVQRVNNFFTADSTSSEPWAYNGEKKLSAMILSVTRAESPICVLTNNHGESLFDENGEISEEYTTFIKLIEGAGYEVAVIDLEKDDIPENCRMIVTLDPDEDFKAFGNLGEGNVSEIEKLDRYLDGANSFFYICDKDTPVLKNLEEYLEEWGVVVARVTDGAGNSENYAIVDEVNCTDAGEGRAVVGDYALAGLGATLTSDMRARSYAPKVVFGNGTAIIPSENYIRSYATADEENGTPAYIYYKYYKNGVMRNMFDIFSTYSTASALVGGEIYEIATENDRFKLMTVTQETRSVQDGSYDVVNQASYVLSLASTEFLTNEVLDSAAYGNTDVILSALRSTSSEVVTADVDLKVFYNYGVDNQAAYLANKPEAWAWCLVLIPVCAVVVTGTVITVRRKYR